MMINLSNYEEYFLLYIDNELSKEKCEAVEAIYIATSTPCSGTEYVKRVQAAAGR